jgi:hypothetical protein
MTVFDLPNIHPDFKRIATSYVDSQIQTMEKYGSKPHLSQAEYDALVSEMEEVGKKIYESHRREERV